MPNPLEILQKAVKFAKTEEDLLRMVALAGDAPPPTFKPPVSTPPPQVVAPMHNGPVSPLVPPRKQAMVPPMTLGESRTIPRAGESLLGGY